jgi:mannosyl-oligosaccharide alpha-1,3-glucosidase
MHALISTPSSQLYSIISIDCFSSAARDWWKVQFQRDKFKVTSPNTLWNNMNEPSVFNGPETTMLKYNLHLGN